ncbi:MAG: archaellin/type IV pilin N-terminal domain-containing protein [Thermoplasmata archaeon]
MKKIWAVRKDSEAVSPVIATILMVAITVVLAAVLYVMVLGFGTDTSQTPTSSLTKSSITNGWRFTFATVNEDVSWDDITVTIISGSSVWSWTNITAADLDGGTAVLKNYGEIATGSPAVTLKVMDLTGNGKTDGGDFIELTASSFSASVDYDLRVIYDPTAQPMCSLTFSG